MKPFKKVCIKYLLIGKKVGTFQSQVIFSIFYIVVMSIFGIAYRLFFDPLEIRKKIKGSNFKAWPHRKVNLESARMQY